MIFIPRIERKLLPRLIITVKTANYLLPDFVEEHGLWKGLREALKIGWLLTGPKIPPASHPKETTKQPQEDL